MDRVDTTAANEVAVTRMALRTGGWIGYTDDALFIDRDDEKIKIPHEHVTQLGRRTLEWDLAVMSLLLVGVGGYVVLTRHPLVGAAFALIGCLSLYRTYGKRHELVIRVENRPKPVRVYPAHPGECYETLHDRIAS